MSIIKTFKDKLNNIIYPTTHAKAVYVDKLDGSVENLQKHVSSVENGTNINTFNGVETALSTKVDKVTGKGLSTNDYTDNAKAIVDGIDTALNTKVDKVQGKQLSTNDYTSEEKLKLASLENYDDTEITGRISDVEDALTNKADKVTNATSGNVATLDANGNLTDSGKTLGKSVPSDAVFSDVSVKQTNATSDPDYDYDYRLALSKSPNDTTETGGVRKSTNFKANPSTGVLSTPKVKISKSANALITGSGTAGSDKGSGVSPRYYPAKWTFNLGGNPADGDIITIKIPVAGGTYSEWLSTDNGTTYHPIALNGKSRITSQYAVNTYLTLIYESSGVCTTYALAGADSTADVTGTWRVINYYDSNTTYSSMSQTEATTGTATTGRLITAKVLNDTISNKISDKADKAVPSVSGNVATLDTNGNLVDSGKTLGASVPSDAVFTDTNTTYSMSLADSSIVLTPSTGTAETIPMNDLINSLPAATGDPSDNTNYITQNNDSTKTTYYRRPASAIWNYIKGKIGIASSGSTFLRIDGTWATPTNTKNTAGSTDSSSKLFLIGATSQAANPQTYSHDTAYVGTDGCLYSGGEKVLTSHQDISGKADKVSGATNGNFAGLDSNGNVIDSGKKPGDYLGTTLKGAANGVASLDANGKVTKSQLPSMWEKYVKNGKTSTSGSLDLFTISNLIITDDTLIDDPYCDKQGVDYVEMSVTASTNSTTANGSITVKYNTSDAVTKVSVLIMN